MESVGGIGETRSFTGVDILSLVSSRGRSIPTPLLRPQSYTLRAPSHGTCFFCEVSKLSVSRHTGTRSKTGETRRWCRDILLSNLSKSDSGEARDSRYQDPSPQCDPRVRGRIKMSRVYGLLSQGASETGGRGTEERGGIPTVDFLPPKGPPLPRPITHSQHANPVIPTLSLSSPLPKGEWSQGRTRTKVIMGDRSVDPVRGRVDVHPTTGVSVRTERGGNPPPWESL